MTLLKLFLLDLWHFWSFFSKLPSIINLNKSSKVACFWLNGRVNVKEAKANLLKSPFISISWYRPNLPPPLFDRTQKGKPKKGSETDKTCWNTSSLHSSLISRSFSHPRTHFPPVVCCLAGQFFYLHELGVQSRCSHFLRRRGLLGPSSAVVTAWGLPRTVGSRGCYSIRLGAWVALLRSMNRSLLTRILILWWEECVAAVLFKGGVFLVV